MTTPTPDAAGNIAPGYYYAEGDPPGTVRYWDGTQWTGSPMPSPPGASPAAPNAAGFSQERFGGMGIRIGAILLDGLVFLVVAVLVSLPFADNVSNSDTSFEFQVTGGAVFIGPLVYLALTIVMVATIGASPGKLMVGLRITTADGTTPPGYGPAALRSLPWLPTLIPLLGVVIWLGIVIASLVTISNDAERRSLFDRVANTRVVRKSAL